MTSGPEVAVIPAAGRGTRMRPATRAIPKAFLPVVDQPAVQYVVEEAARAGAREIYVVVDPGTAELVRRHFGGNETQPFMNGVRVEPIVQESPLGLGHAVLAAEAAVGERTFMCLLADNLTVPNGLEPLSRMIAAAPGTSTLCLREIPEDRLHHYGVIEPGPSLGDGVVAVLGAVEKPLAGESPSRLAIMGRYLFQPEIFDDLRELTPRQGGEIQLTDAIDRLARRGSCTGVVGACDLLDVGSPLGLLHASTRIGLAHADYGGAYLEFLNDMLLPEASAD